MRFRYKLLLLLLAVSLVPLLLNGALYQTTLRKISDKLATETRDTLQEHALEQLQSLVHYQALLLHKDRAFILQALSAQTREIEHILARKKTPTAAELTPSYRSIQQANPKHYIWHATFLNTGLESVFPPKALTSTQRIDLESKLKLQSTHWQLKVNNGQLHITVCSPIYFPDGTFAGITAINFDQQQFLTGWQLPHPWDQYGRLFVVSIAAEASAPNLPLNIHLEIFNQNTQPQRDTNPQLILDASAANSAREKLIEAFEKGATGFFALEFDAKESTWIYAGASKTEPFPLLIIPNTQINLPANHAATFVEEQFTDALKKTALLSLGVLLCVTIIGMLRARAVTRPIAALVEAAERLAQEDFTTRVAISSKDEFEELGRAFNRIGPHLKERQEIKQALAAAKEIQQLILPEAAPEIKGFDLYGRLDYCDEIGGDYYDFIKTTTDNWCLAVGDVIGHGIGAALLMTSVAGILQSTIANGVDDLGILFSRLNTFLMNNGEDTRFMTLFVAQLDPNARSLHWLSAGHGPVYLYRAETQKVEELPPTTIPIGILDAVEFTPVHKETLQQGDILFIGTDGIWEATNAAGEMFGSSHVLPILRDAAEDTAAEIAARTFRAVDKFCGTAPQKDDRTLVVLKVG